MSISTEVCNLGCHNWREGQINLGRRVPVVAGHQSSATPAHQEDVSLDSKVKGEGRGGEGRGGEGRGGEGRGSQQ